MNKHDPTPVRTTIPYSCSSCSRCFVAFCAVEEAILCVCGAPLRRRPLLRGLYELGPSLPNDDELPADPGGAPIPEEPDVGYGASHGYDVSHGGPSGPGDAPADVAVSARGR